MPAPAGDRSSLPLPEDETSLPRPRSGVPLPSGVDLPPPLPVVKEDFSEDVLSARSRPSEPTPVPGPRGRRLAVVTLGEEPVGEPRLEWEGEGGTAPRKDEAPLSVRDLAPRRDGVRENGIRREAAAGNSLEAVKPPPPPLLLLVPLSEVNEEEVRIVGGVATLRGTEPNVGEGETTGPPGWFGVEGVEGEAAVRPTIGRLADRLGDMASEAREGGCNTSSEADVVMPR